MTWIRAQKGTMLMRPIVVQIEEYPASAKDALPYKLVGYSGDASWFHLASYGTEAEAQAALCAIVDAVKNGAHFVDLSALQEERGGAS